MAKIYILLITASLFFAGCKTATKAFNKGDYADAIELGVKKLNKDPYDADTKELVKTAYTFAVNNHEEAIRNLSGSNSDSRYESILKEYNKLQDLYNTIHEYPAVAHMIPATNYSEYIQTYRNKAAEVHVSNGDKWMNEGNKRAYREAYNEYRNALRYTNNGDIKKKRDDAYNSALTKVLIVPIQNYGGYSYNSSYQLQQFQRKLCAEGGCTA